MQAAMDAGVHEGVSAVHIRIAELAAVTADAAEELVWRCAVEGPWLSSPRFRWMRVQRCLSRT